MDRQREIDTERILRTSKVGLWCVMAEEGKASRFYADEVMDKLLGTPEGVTPEERFLFHRAHIHPDDVQMFEEYSDKLAEVRTEIVYRYIHPICGEMIVRCGGIRDTSMSDCFCITGTHQDISDTMRLEREKEAERRLAEMNNTLLQERMQREDYYRELLDMQSCGVMAYTLPSHKVVHMNAQALRMYDLKSVEDAQNNLGKVLGNIYYPNPETVEELKNLRNEDDMVDYECVLDKGGTHECHIMAKSKVIRVPSGERTVINTFLDVSDMVTLKDALRRAEEGSRAKSAFLFAMSHDLRTPMNAIIGYADLMERHWGEKELTIEYLKKLKEAGFFLLDLIGNVLELARIESGQEMLNEIPTNLAEIQDSLEIILDKDIANKSLQIEKCIHITHPNIYCDTLKIREILMNLLSNAIKYTPENGRIVLTIEELPADKEGYALYKTVVEDNGIGISEEYLPHLFEAFTRERSSSESGIRGTGLGLRIVKNFVDMMDGSISVESEQGKGTKFTMLISHKIAEPEKLKTEEKNVAEEKATLEGRRFLLAEDNDLNAEIAMTLLEDVHASIERAADGEQAVSMLKEKPVGYYDLILMDIQMPRMNGYQATKAIRQLSDKRADIPIIAMTVNAFEEDRKAAYEAGMNGYVTKPIELAKVVGTITEVLEQQE